MEFIYELGFAPASIYQDAESTYFISLLNAVLNRT